MTRRVATRYNYLSTLYEPHLIVQNLVTRKQILFGLFYYPWLACNSHVLL